MPKTMPFEGHPDQYDDWFENNSYAYQSELTAIKEELPQRGEGMEIGVGSGRFAAPLGIRIGLEPATGMWKMARERGINVVAGVAEVLPFCDNCFDFSLMVTTLCFLDDIKRAFDEAYRVIKPGGSFIAGFVDKDSLLGRQYLKHKNESTFYRLATFYSVDQVLELLKKAGFENQHFTQTIFRPLKEIDSIEGPKEGYGEGSFVVLRANKDT